MKTIRYQSLLNGVISTDLDAVPTITVVREDNSGTIVNNQNMTRQSTGDYDYSFAEPAAGLIYDYTVTGIYLGLPVIIVGSVGETVDAAAIDAELSASHGGGPWGGVTIQGTVSAPAGPAIDGTEIDCFCNYPLTQNFAITGLISTGWTEFVFTVKRCADIASDAAALVAVKVSDPAAGTDGLFTLNGAPPASPASAADGAITVNGTAVNTEVVLALTARGMAIPAGAWAWELTRWSGGAGTKYLVGRGGFTATQVVRRSPVQT